MRIFELMAKYHKMPADEAQALTQAYVTLRDALHHRALQELPGHVEPEAYAAERQTVLNSWQRWLITPASILA